VEGTCFGKELGIKLKVYLEELEKFNGIGYCY
jgi:hypothetical protein